MDIKNILWGTCKKSSLGILSGKKFSFIIFPLFVNTDLCFPSNNSEKKTNQIKKPSSSFQYKASFLENETLNNFVIASLVEVHRYLAE